jgi:hypothetical protein
MDSKTFPAMGLKKISLQGPKTICYVGMQKVSFQGPEDLSFMWECKRSNSRDRKAFPKWGNEKGPPPGGTVRLFRHRGKKGLTPGP